MSPYISHIDPLDCSRFSPGAAPRLSPLKHAGVHARTEEMASTEPTTEDPAGGRPTIAMNHY